MRATKVIARSVKTLTKRLEIEKPSFLQSHCTMSPPTFDIACAKNN